MTRTPSPAPKGTFECSDLFLGGLNLAVETEKLIPKSSSQICSQSPKLQATEAHSKVSLLHSYPGHYEKYPLDWKNLLGWEEFLTIKYQWPQVLLALLLLLVAVYLDCLAQVYIQLYPANSSHPDCWKAPPLFDVGFWLLGLWNVPRASDYALFVFMSVTVFRFIIFPGPFSARWTLIRRWLVCTAQLFLLRGFSIMCTILPNPDPYCISTVTKGNIFSLALEVIIGAKVTCRDVLYSGHAVHFTLCALIWRDYSPLCPLWFPPCWERLQVTRVLAYLSALVGYGIIICTHFHYTVDVWIAFWMTYFVWSYYHEVIKACSFHRGSLMCFLTWIEQHATDLREWRIRVKKQMAYDDELRQQKGQEAV